MKLCTTKCAFLHFRFLINLVLVNLLTCITWIPLAIYDSSINVIKNDEDDGEVTNLSPQYFICAAIIGISSAISSITMFAHLLIGIDQHLAVVDSLHYHQRINEKVCNFLCFSVWTLGITLGVLAPIKINNVEAEFHENDLQNSYQSNYSIINCHIKQESDTYRKALTITTSLLSFILPLILLIFIYGRIFFEAHQNSERTRRNSAASTTMETVRPNNNRYFQYPIQYSGKHLDVSLMNLQQGNTPSPSVRSNNSSLSQMANNMRRSVKYKMSHANAMVLYYGKIEEGRTAKITILVILMIIFCWTPYYSVTIAMVMNLADISGNIEKLSIVCAFSNTIISPLLYAYRSRRVKRDINVSKYAFI